MKSWYNSVNVTDGLITLSWKCVCLCVVCDFTLSSVRPTNRNNSDNKITSLIDGQ